MQCNVMYVEIDRCRQAEGHFHSNSDLFKIPHVLPQLPARVVTRSRPAHVHRSPPSPLPARQPPLASASFLFCIFLFFFFSLPRSIHPGGPSATCSSALFGPGSTRSPRYNVHHHHPSIQLPLDNSSSRQAARIRRWLVMQPPIPPPRLARWQGGWYLHGCCLPETHRWDP